MADDAFVGPIDTSTPQFTRHVVTDPTRHHPAASCTAVPSGRCPPPDDPLDDPPYDTPEDAPDDPPDDRRPTGDQSSDLVRDTAACSSVRAKTPLAGRSAPLRALSGARSAANHERRIPGRHTAAPNTIGPSERHPFRPCLICGNVGRRTHAEDAGAAAARLGTVGHRGTVRRGLYPAERWQGGGDRPAVGRQSAGRRVARGEVFTGAHQRGAAEKQSPRGPRRPPLDPPSGGRSTPPHTGGILDIAE